MNKKSLSPAGSPLAQNFAAPPNFPPPSLQLTFILSRIGRLLVKIRLDTMYLSEGFHKVRFVSLGLQYFNAISNGINRRLRLQICKKPYAFDGVLTIRLSWLSDAISLMLDYLQSAKAGDRSPHSRRVPPTTPTRIGLLPSRFSCFAFALTFQSFLHCRNSSDGFLLGYL